MARPTKCTPEAVELFCGVVRTGGSTAQACKAAGIHLTTYHDWRKLDGDPFAHFRRALTDARAVAERERLRKLYASWSQGTRAQRRAAVWLLAQLRAA